MEVPQKTKNRAIISSVQFKLLSRVRLLVTPWTVAQQGPLFVESFRQEYWSWVVVPLSRGSS